MVSVLLAVGVVAAAQAPASDVRSEAECSQTSTGLIPLTDLGKRRYKGQRGRLYPNGLNHPRRTYLRQGLAAAKRVRPVNGRVVLLSIGMSNTTQEFHPFMRLAAGDSELSPTVKLVDGAIGGWDARRVSRPTGGYWTALDRRLRGQGVTPLEVQVVWLKEAIAGEDRPFPQDARALEGPSADDRPDPRPAVPEPPPDLHVQPHLRRVRRHGAQPGAGGVRQRLRGALAGSGPDRRQAEGALDRLGAVSLDGRQRGRADGLHLDVRGRSQGRNASVARGGGQGRPSAAPVLQDRSDRQDLVHAARAAGNPHAPLSVWARP